MQDVVTPVQSTLSLQSVQAKYNALINLKKNLLGCVIPLGRPRSVYKSDVESSFLNSESKWPNGLEGQGQSTYFDTSWGSKIKSKNKSKSKN